MKHLEQAVFEFTGLLHEVGSGAEGFIREDRMEVGASR